MELVQAVETISQSMVWASIFIPFVASVLLAVVYSFAK